jgi:hypothetical protein
LFLTALFFTLLPSVKKDPVSSRFIIPGFKYSVYRSTTFLFSPLQQKKTEGTYLLLTTYYLPFVVKNNFKKRKKKGGSYFF